MPVRIKQRVVKEENRRTKDKEWEALHKDLVGLLLAWNVAVSVVLRGTGTSQKLQIRTLEHEKEASRVDPNIYATTQSFDEGRILGIMKQGLSMNLPDLDSWIKTSARTPLMTIRAVFSLQPAPSKQAQFISLGVRHINTEAKGNMIYDEVNQIFESSGFGVLDEHPKTGDDTSYRLPKDKRFHRNTFTNRHMRKNAKGIDKWPMFYIRVDLHEDLSCAKHDPTCPETHKALLSIINVLEAMITGFLVENHFHPSNKRCKNKGAVTGRSLNPNLQSSSAPSTRGTGLIGDHAAFPTLPDQFTGASHASVSKPAYERAPLASESGVYGNVKMPNFARGLSSQSSGYLTRWSRIKSGREHDILSKATLGESFVQASSLTYKYTNETDIHQLAARSGVTDKIDECVYFAKDMGSGSEARSHANEIRLPCQSLAASTDPAHEPRAVESNSVLDLKYGTHINALDDTLNWTNPVSGNTFLINARTGLLVDRHSELPLSLQRRTNNNNNTHIVHSAAQLGGLRLNRSASDPTVPSRGEIWSSKVLGNWENPVYGRTEEDITQISLQSSEGEFNNNIWGRNHRSSAGGLHRAFVELSSTSITQLSKAALRSAAVISQVDRKFLLITTDTAALSKTTLQDPSSRLVVLIDQHAADERIRVENLLVELCKRPSTEIANLRSNLDHRSAIATTELLLPISFKIQLSERELFKRHAAHFAQWGILYDMKNANAGVSIVGSRDTCTITVKTLPPCIAERCRVDTKQLVDLLRGETWRREELEIGGSGSASACMSRGSPQAHRYTEDATSISITDGHWLKRIHQCPHGILEMLNSRSCRSAIMFNDNLDIEECETLVRRLSECIFPFQCAHGRPSMIPLVELGPETGNSVTSGLGIKAAESIQQERGFLDAWRAWKKIEQYK